MTQVEKFGYYMYNQWNYDESVLIFGKDLGNHIFNKWCDDRDVMHFFMSLDSECRLKLIARAEHFYK
jgi:hypothetical protein